MKKHVPNIITLGNLTCGLLSILYAFSDTPWIGAYFIFGGLFLDFFDGFFARILKVDGELGKQLDSLADLVTFGVAPGMLMFMTCRQLILGHLFLLDETPFVPRYAVEYAYTSPHNDKWFLLLPMIALMIPLLSAVRLAKFNISTNQTNEFIGLPTPANAIFFSSISILVFNNFDEISISMEGLVYLLLGITVAMSLLLNANLPLIALKFKTFGWKGNEVRFVFLGLSLVTILLTLLISNVFVAVPIIILLYLIISIINNITKRKNEIQSKH